MDSVQNSLKAFAFVIVIQKIIEFGFGIVSFRARQDYLPQLHFENKIELAA